jgi:hypothetical protein
MRLRQGTPERGGTGYAGPGARALATAQEKRTSAGWGGRSFCKNAVRRLVRVSADTTKTCGLRAYSRAPEFFLRDGEMVSGCTAVSDAEIVG